MGKTWVKLVCSQKVKDRIMKECVEEYLEHHPEDEERHITQNFILDKISKHYLEN